MLHTRSPACACKSAYQVENTHVQRLSYSLMLPSSLADQNWFGLPGATSTSCESDSHVSIHPPRNADGMSQLPL